MSHMLTLRWKPVVLGCQVLANWGSGEDLPKWVSGIFSFALHSSRHDFQKCGNLFTPDLPASFFLCPQSSTRSSIGQTVISVGEQLQSDRKTPAASNPNSDRNIIPPYAVGTSNEALPPDCLVSCYDPSYPIQDTSLLRAKIQPTITTPVDVSPARPIEEPTQPGPGQSSYNSENDSLRWSRMDARQRRRERRRLSENAGKVVLQLSWKRSWIFFLFPQIQEIA